MGRHGRPGARRDCVAGASGLTAARREPPGLGATIAAGGCAGLAALGVQFTFGVVVMIWFGRDNLAGVEWAAAAMLAISVGSTCLFAWWARSLWRGEARPESPWGRPSIGMPCAWRGMRAYDLTWRQSMGWGPPPTGRPYMPHADKVLGRRPPQFAGSGTGLCAPDLLHVWAARGR